MGGIACRDQVADDAVGVYLIAADPDRPGFLRARARNADPGATMSDAEAGRFRALHTSATPPPPRAGAWRYEVGQPPAVTAVDGHCTALWLAWDREGVPPGPVIVMVTAAAQDAAADDAAVAALFHRAVVALVQHGGGGGPAAAAAEGAPGSGLWPARGQRALYVLEPVQSGTQHGLRTVPARLQRLNEAGRVVPGPRAYPTKPDAESDFHVTETERNGLLRLDQSDETTEIEQTLKILRMVIADGSPHCTPELVLRVPLVLPGVGQPDWATLFLLRDARAGILLPAFAAHAPLDAATLLAVPLCVSLFPAPRPAAAAQSVPVFDVLVLRLGPSDIVLDFMALPDQRRLSETSRALHRTFGGRTVRLAFQYRFWDRLSQLVATNARVQRLNVRPPDGAAATVQAGQHWVAHYLRFVRHLHVMLTGVNVVLSRDYPDRQTWIWPLIWSAVAWPGVERVSVSGILNPCKHQGDALGAALRAREAPLARLELDRHAAQYAGAPSREVLGWESLARAMDGKVDVLHLGALSLLHCLHESRPHPAVPRVNDALVLTGGLRVNAPALADGTLWFQVLRVLHAAPGERLRTLVIEWQTNGWELRSGETIQILPVFPPPTGETWAVRLELVLNGGLEPGPGLMYQTMQQLRALQLCQGGGAGLVLRIVPHNTETFVYAATIEFLLLQVMANRREQLQRWGEETGDRGAVCLHVRLNAQLWESYRAVGYPDSRDGPWTADRASVARWVKHILTVGRLVTETTVPWCLVVDGAGWSGSRWGTGLGGLGERTLDGTAQEEWWRLLATPEDGAWRRRVFVLPSGVTADRAHVLANQAMRAIGMQPSGHQWVATPRDDVSGVALPAQLPWQHR